MLDDPPNHDAWRGSYDAWKTEPPEQVPGSGFPGGKSDAQRQAEYRAWRLANPDRREQEEFEYQAVSNRIWGFNSLYMVLR